MHCLLKNHAMRLAEMTTHIKTKMKCYFLKCLIEKVKLLSEEFLNSTGRKTRINSEMITITVSFC